MVNEYISTRDKVMIEIVRGVESVPEEKQAYSIDVCDARQEQIQAISLETEEKK